MNQRYAQVILQKESMGWRLMDCSTEFLKMTGFTSEEILSRFEDRFLHMLSAADMPAVDELFSSPDGREPLCPWIFSLTCKDKDSALPVLLQAIRLTDNSLRVLVHDASFLGEQVAKMGRRILSLEQSIPSGLVQVLYDDDLTIIWHNDSFLEILGYTESQFVEETGCKARNYVHPDDLKTVGTRLESMFALGERTISDEMRVMRRDGTILTLMVTFGMTDETICGVPVLYSSGMDITAKSRAQELEIDAERMRVAMEQSSSYVLEYVVQEKRILFSDSLHIFFGFHDDAENVPESLMQAGVVAAGSDETLYEIFREIDQGAGRSEGTVCLHSLRDQGEDRWFRVRLTTIATDGDKPERALLLAEDITERYLIEMRYKEEENRRVAMTYDMSFSFQFDLTAGKILDINKAKFSCFDMTQAETCEELVRRNAAQFVHPDERLEYIKKLSADNMLRQFREGVPELSFDFRAMRSNGVYEWRRGIAHIIREPSRGHVCAYVYTKDIEEEKLRELELRRHAEQDALTGLLNRYTVEICCDEYLEEIASGSIAAMYMLDLDNFKYLNDTYGHMRGDVMLQQAAEGLRKIFGEDTLLGRLGGDELVAFQPNCTSAEEAEQFAQQICADLRELEACENVVTVSVGLAFAPQDGHHFAELYRSADDALYEAKRGGKNRWSTYHRTEKGRARAVERMSTNREWLLEESSDLIYVCDFYSYDMLYMNRGARELYGVEETEYIGKKCYEVLYQADCPCDFCTNHLLCRETFYAWEFRNDKIDRSFLLRDRIVDWYGMPARIDFATDISVMEKRNRILEEQVEIDHAIIQCLRILSGAKMFEAAVEPMLRQIALFYGADRVVILLYEAELDRMKYEYEWYGEDVPSVIQLMPKSGLPLVSCIRESFKTSRSVCIDRMENEPPSMYRDLMIAAEVDCLRGIPFYVNGQPVGLLCVDNPTNFVNELTVLETLGYFIAEEISRSRLSERLSYLGYHDSLTGLWNRNWYVEYQNRLKPGDIQSIGIAVADINALKEVNKLRGHTEGDEVVKRTAELLRLSFPDAQIFRLSGDEFVVHSENIPRAKFLEQIQQVRENAAGLMAYGISVGHAWSDRDINFQKLTSQAADIMMMQKREHYQYERAAHEQGKHNHARLQELIANMESGYFKMYLQPKASCADGKLCGAEALIRFEGPEGGLVSPDRFIPMFEQEHTIQYVDIFIFEEVCKLLARWQAEGRELLIVSLNFSRQTVLEPNLLRTLLAMAERYQVPKAFIEVEITETIGDYENTTIAEIGEGIKQAGFRLALDDFGSNYANMAMLSAVPVDVLKLDRSLIRDVMYSRPNQMVLKSILSLCREMKIASIAEGVETQEQLSLLCELGCDEIQGYLFGRPTTIEDFEERYLSEAKR